MNSKKQDIAYFISFCIEQYKNEKKITGETASQILYEYGVLSYLYEHYEVLHTQSRQWILEDIEEFIELRKTKKIMNLEINQDNLYLLLPGKIAWMTEMLMEDKDVSIVDAIREIYSSATYKKLETESSKIWHLGPVALYEKLSEEK